MKIIAIAAISLDGKIALHEQQSSLSWTSKADTRFFVEKTKELGTLVMGRKTFETIGKSLPGRKTIVLTRQPEEYALQEEPGVLEFKNTTPEVLVAQLKKEETVSVAVVGGTAVYSQFVKQDLIDEWFLTIIPVWFGKGVPLLQEVEQQEFAVNEVKQLDEKTVLCHLLKRKKA